MKKQFIIAQPLPARITRLSSKTKFVTSLMMGVLVFSSVQQANAVDISVGTAITTPQIFVLNNQKLTVSAGGDLTVDTSSIIAPNLVALPSVSAALNTGLQVQVDADVGEGIAATGNSFGAIEITGAASLSSASINSGRVTSDKVGGGTILLGGAANAVSTITTLANATISNSVSGGYAIRATSDNITLNINNAGSITSSNNSSSIVMNLSDADGGSSYSVSNSGALSTSILGKSINIANSGNSLMLSNTGAGYIAGSITVNGNNATIINNTTGYITGAISSSTGNISITNNAGNITGNISTSSGDLDVVQAAGIINSNINLGNNAGSTLTLNGGSITGNVTLNNSNQTLTFNGGSITGTINGAGKIIVSAATTVNGNIGVSHSVDSLTISDGITLNARDNNNTIAATALSIGNGSILQLGTGAVTGSINGSAEGKGTVAFGSTQTTAGTIGSDTRLAAITVANGATVTLGNNIAANTITIGGGSSGQVSTNGKNISATNINMASGSTLNINYASTISGAINGSTAGRGTVQFSGNGTYSNSSEIGATNKVSSVTIGNGTTVNNSSTIKASTITIGGGTSGALTQTAGALGSNDAAINIANGATLTYSGGSLAGTIDGVGDDQGTLIINNDLVVNKVIGGTHSLHELDIAAGKTLSVRSNGLSSDVTASNINVSGTLDLSNTNHVLIGNIVGTGTGTIDIGSNTHVIDSSNFTLNSGDTLGVTLTSSTIGGQMFVGGIVSNSATSNVKVTLNTGSNYIANGSRYTILTGDNSGLTLNAIGTANINVNNTGTNKFGFLTFTTTQEGSDLNLIVTRNAIAAVSNNSSANGVYEAINDIGAGASGSMRTLQNYLDSGVSDSQVVEALRSATAQTDNSLHKNLFNSVNSSIKTAEDRLDNLRGVSSGDEESTKSAWAQTFGTAAKQGSVGSDEGFKMNSLGFALGSDKKIDKNTRLGAALSYANSNVKTFSGLKKTKVDTYQANIYSSQNFGKYFFDTIFGFAFSEYDSSRAIPVASVVATSKYNGHSYVAKLRGGYLQDLGGGFSLTPEIMLNYVHNVISKYTENGANTLNLNVQGSSSNFLEGRVGTILGYNVLTYNCTRINPNLKVSYGYDFIGDRQTTVSNFVGQTSSFTSQVARVGRSSLKLGAGIDVYRIDDIILSADYVFEHKLNYHSHSGLARIKYQF